MLCPGPLLFGSPLSTVCLVKKQRLISTKFPGPSLEPAHALLFCPATLQALEEKCCHLPHYTWPAWGTCMATETKHGTSSHTCLLCSLLPLLHGPGAPINPPFRYHPTELSPWSPRPASPELDSASMAVLEPWEPTPAAL